MARRRAKLYVQFFKHNFDEASWRKWSPNMTRPFPIDLTLAQKIFRRIFISFAICEKIDFFRSSDDYHWKEQRLDYRIGKLEKILLFCLGVLEF